MIQNPPKHVIEALVALSTDKDFQAVTQGLQASLTDTEKRMTAERDSIELRRLQGAAEDLNTLTDTIRDAHKIMETMRTKR